MFVRFGRIDRLVSLWGKAPICVKNMDDVALPDNARREFVVKRTRTEARLPPYRASELARRWGVSRNTVLEAVKSGQLEGFRLKRVWLISRASAHRLERGDIV